MEKLIEELKVLRVKEGETLVVQCESILTMAQHEWLKECFKSAGVRAVIMDGGLKVAAVQC